MWVRGLRYSLTNGSNLSQDKCVSLLYKSEVLQKNLHRAISTSCLREAALGTNIFLKNKSLSKSYNFGSVIGFIRLECAVMYIRVLIALFFKEEKSQHYHWDSNPRPTDCESGCDTIRPLRFKRIIYIYIYKMILKFV